MANLLTASLLAEPAPRAARVVAHARLTELRDAFEAFEAKPAIGFHDVRVAMRRLRSWERAFRPELADTVRAKTRRRFGRLADATNAVRDAEVQMEWIGAQEDLSPRERRGVTYLLEQIEAEHRDAAHAARELVVARLPNAMHAFERELAEYTVAHAIADAEEVPSMRQALGDALTVAVERLANAIERAALPDDAAELHRVRIAAKRVRYLLEPLPNDLATASLIERLTALQDGLGICHDRHVLIARIIRDLGQLGARDARLLGLRAAGIEVAASERAWLPRFRPGLVTLATRAHQEERAAYETFRSNWDAQAAAKISTTTERLLNAS